MIPENTDEHLGKKAFVLFALEKMKWVFVLIAVTIFLSIVRDAARAPALVGIVSFLSKVSWFSLIFGSLWAWVLYKNFTFRLEEFGIKMRSGVIQKREVMIPYRHIQSIDIVRSLPHQMLGLSKLIMLTAGSEDLPEKHLTEVVLEPIDSALAIAIRDALQHKIGVQVVRPEIGRVEGLDARTER
jgi:uncharacterized membrane protein YdbT with pleckstrin-like domain